MNREQVEKAFARVRAELFFPPCNLSLTTEENASRIRAPFYVLGSTVYINPLAIPSGCDAEKFLLSVMRHEVSHIHYCPYDIRTGQGLVRMAYETTRDWGLSFFILALFADLNVDCLYLKRRFAQTPYHAIIESSKGHTGDKKLIQRAYEALLPDLKRQESEEYIEMAAREIKMIMSSGKDWYRKVYMISRVVLRLKREYGMNFKLDSSFFHFGGRSVPIREDLRKDPLSELSDVYGEIRDTDEARAFYKYWVEPRLDEDYKSNLKEAKKKLGSRTKKDSEKVDEGLKIGEGKHRAKKLGAPILTEGEEPQLPTEMSQIYEKLPDPILTEAMWKVFWYKSRAQRILLRYLEEGRRPEPKLSISQYPDDWSVEDEVEDLDIEASLDEGPLMVEVNMMKWVEEARGQGHSFTIRRSPSSLIVLDSSKSMRNVMDQASTSAMVAHLSTRRAGGLTSTITFSTNYVSTGWRTHEMEEQLALSLFLGQYTILPVHEIVRIIRDSANAVVVTIITDCGWQNIEESLTELESIVREGNNITIFYLRGGEYREKLSRIATLSGVKVIEVRDPERDLENMVLSESVRIFGRYMDYAGSQKNHAAENEPAD